VSEADDPEVRESVDHLFRHRAGQMVAVLARQLGLGHLDLIEEAKNRALDRLRRDSSWRGKRQVLERSTPTAVGPDDDSGFGGELTDDQLRMIFACCHPAVPGEARVALTLKTVGGFSVSEIARAFLSREAAVAQRLVRAKERLKQRGVRLEMPPPERLAARLDSVLEVLYLIFNEGYSAHQGEDLVRADLCREAIRLSELLAGNPLTGVPRASALAALFCFQAARLPARADAAGDLLLLADQDRSSWDRRLLARALEHLRRSARGDELSAYHLEAEIASCHGLAPSWEATDWGRILSCYEALLERRPSPVVRLNRAIAVAQLRGPEAGLAELAVLAGVRALRRYYPLYATRGELLRRLGRGPEAAGCYREALGLTSSEPVRRFLRKRLASIEAERG
jgi:predicted RNA polymerase sigma factor